jgi:RNA polymerase sigma factor (sigma-70 family)
MSDETCFSLDVSDRVEAAYAANYKLLSFLAFRRFRIPEDEVCAVIHDVFVAFIQSAERIRATLDDERAWLVGAVCNASRHYWRKHGRTSAFTPDDARRIGSDDVADDALDRIELASVLRDLPAHCRDLLSRHYGEGYTAGEIAPAYALKPSSTSNLISKCLFAARAAFTRRRRR